VTTHIHARHVAAALAAAVPDAEHDSAAITSGTALHVSLTDVGSAMRFLAALVLELTDGTRSTPWMTKAEALAFAATWHNVYDDQVEDKGVVTTAGSIVLWAPDVAVRGIEPGTAFAPADVLGYRHTADCSQSADECRCLPATEGGAR
jgi:hypothetical protein